jgi:sucrose-phosphate synthase
MSVSGIYIQLFSIHGLIRSNSPELGRDADTGGQIKYVLELAKTLAQHPKVKQVDLFTRLVEDKTVSNDYSRRIEPLSDKARIVRIQCGGKKYIRKELLWPYLDEFVDKTVKFIKAQNLMPDFCHGHYADGGYVAMELSDIFDVPLIFTGHSMGRHKKNKLLEEGMSEGQINNRYHINRRIKVEEEIIKKSDMIITSTNHEVNEQYKLYKNYKDGQYTILPPGIDLNTFYPYYNRQLDPKYDTESTKQVRIALLQELHRFWKKSEKPFILTVCRPDHRKNIAGLIKAYGEDKELQAIANLAIFAGIRKNINEMEENEQNVLTQMLLLMDKYDLYGKLAIPKKHNFALEIPKLYRLCADSKGVFINPALVEPFGITLIEAAACGLPIVATQNGGPSDIIRNCDNGILIDPNNSAEISQKAKEILIDDELWKKYSGNGINGVRKNYSWDSHCLKFVKETENIESKKAVHEGGGVIIKSKGIGRRLTSLNKLLITDIDNTLVGDSFSLNKLLDIFGKNKKILGWGVASGRSLEQVMEVLEEKHIPIPDIIISSVGAEIYYGDKFFSDKGWETHLNKEWKPKRIQEVLSPLDFLYPQKESTQRKYKISYLMEDKPDLLADIHNRLQSARLKYNLIFSHHQFLDILPFRASKGKALRYIGYKWEIPIGNIMSCGDSGNDEDMLKGNSLGVVVGNYSEELENLRGLKNIFFSRHQYAAGIIDGIRHYNFLNPVYS